MVADSEERGKAIDGLSATASITARYDVSESDYLQGRLKHNEKFEEMLVDLYASLLIFYAKAACYFAHHTLTVALRNIVKQDDWTSALANIHKADAECKDLISILTGSSLLAGQAKTEEMLGSLLASTEDTRIQNILQWTSQIDVGEQHLTVKEKLGEKYSKSGQWLLQSDEFKSWLGGTPQSFWLKGAVGTGKSSLVSMVIDHVKQQSTNLAWFYCNVGITNWDENSLMVIARALVSQLALSPDGKTVAEEVKILYGDAVENGQAGSKLGSEQCWHLLVALIESRDGTTIIIDALDECPKSAELLSRLSSLSTAYPKLDFFFSSQLVVSVVDYFQRTEAAMITSSRNSDDIAAFINGEVERFEEVRPGLLSPELKSDIVETLSRHAEGMYVTILQTTRNLRLTRIGSNGHNCAYS